MSVGVQRDSTTPNPHFSKNPNHIIPRQIGCLGNKDAEGEISDDFFNPTSMNAALQSS